MEASPRLGEMIPFEQAFNLALDAATALSTERVALDASLGRILAEDVRADMDMPPFNKSIVDGYACRREDLPGPFEQVESIQAGARPTRIVETGQCAKIMTGAMVPDGADCVFLVEHSEASADGQVRFTGSETSDNISPRGQDIREGDVLLRHGARIFPQHVAVLAAMGCAKALVYRRPRVAVIATGDELVEPHIKPSTSQIRNSNSYQLCAQLEAMGAEASYQGIAVDTEESLNAVVGGALTSHDVVLLSGGVSMGDYDLVPGILKAHGLRLVFDKVAVQPGKPTVFAQSDSVFCFGLPGNPVSSFVIFELIVKPFLFKLMGHDYRVPKLVLPLAEAFTRKSGAREAWVPVRLTNDAQVARLEYHGSAHINALSDADGLIPFPQGVTRLEEGSSVPIRLIRS